jgi:hypothetical protein
MALPPEPLNFRGGIHASVRKDPGLMTSRNTRRGKGPRPTVWTIELSALVPCRAARADDELARGALQLQLRKLLAEDAALADDVSRLLEQGKQAGVMADNGAVMIVHADHGGVAAGGNITVNEGGINTGR